MPIKHGKGANRAVASRKKHPDDPRLDSSLYSVKGYVNWLTKVRKDQKKKAHQVDADR